MTLPNYTNRTLYSASIENAWARAMFNAYAVSNARRACFNGAAADYGNETTSSPYLSTFYLYYTGDTTTVHYAVTGAVDFTINGTVYSVTSGDGTFTVSGLTAHTIYEVTASRVANSTAIYWLAFQNSTGSTTAPTIADGTIPTATDFSNTYDAITETEAAAELPFFPHAYSWLSWYKDIGKTEGDYRDVWHGGFIAGHDDLNFNITTSGETGVTLRMVVYIDGSSVLNKTYTATETTSDESIDLSALGLTAGDVSQLQIAFRGEGASGSRLSIYVKLNSMWTSSTPASPIAPEPELSSGDTVDDDQLVKIKSVIDYAHPSYGTTPISIELPAQRIAAISDDSWTPTDFFYVRHANRYLRYISDTGSGDPQIIYSGATIDLDDDGAVHIYDLDDLGDLVFGEYYLVTYCVFVLEDTTDA